MKQLTTKLAVIFLLLAGHSISASAHDQGGSLLNDPSASDYYFFTCDSFTAHAYLQLFAGGSKTAPIVSAQMVKDNAAVSVTDPVTGDNTSSQPVKLSGGPGIYNIVVSKTRPGKVLYSLVYHCEDAGGNHTETDPAQQLQDDIPK